MNKSNTPNLDEIKSGKNLEGCRHAIDELEDDDMMNESSFDFSLKLDQSEASFQL